MRGAWGNAGEIGHIPAVPDGEPCPCGNRGCLERYLSLEALRRATASEAGWVETVAPIFRNAIATVENLFDPEAVVLGGLARPACSSSWLKWPKKIFRIRSHMAGGTFTAFVLARFDVDGTLDNSFGTGGLVTTNIGGAFSQQEALGVAIQPDGRIVVAGYTIRNEVAVACYQPDGQLDETFGTDGVVSGIVTGLANDVTIQPDGRIVIAGRRPRTPLAGTTSTISSSPGSSRTGNWTEASAGTVWWSPTWAA